MRQVTSASVWVSLLGGLVGLRSIVVVGVVGAAGCSGDIRSNVGTNLFPHHDGGAIIPPLIGVSSSDGGPGKGGLPGELTCAAEFPCPMGEECVGGHCIVHPGPCMTNDDCPTGFQCSNGMCAPVCPGMPQCNTDTDCKGGGLCVACTCVNIAQCQKPTPDLSGAPAWTVKQDLHLDQALGAFGQSFAGIVKDLRDAILGCPPGSNGNCWIFEILAAFLPPWSQQLIVGLGNFADLLDNHDFRIDSTMTFTHNNKPSGYDGVDHWTKVTFNYQNMVISEKPENVPQIGQPVIIPFQASAVCGVLYIDKHKVEGVLSGILKWIIDTVVSLSTCQGGGMCYQSLGDAIDGAVDCNALLPNLFNFGICQTFKNGLKNKINQAIDSWLLDYALMTLKGTALVNANGHSLDMGQWDGTLGNGNNIFKNFTGEWSATR